MRPILVVEDDPKDLELLLVAMEMVRMDNPLLTFRDGQEVLDHLLKDGPYGNRPERKPAFILLDLKMPRINGFDVLRKIRVESGIRSIPIIALTASAEQRDLAKAYDLGVSGYVIKPVEFSDLARAIEAIGGMWANHNEVPPEFRKHDKGAE